INEEGLPIVEIQETEENEVQSRITKDEKDDLEPNLKQIGQSKEEEELRASDSLSSFDSDASPSGVFTHVPIKAKQIEPMKARQIEPMKAGQTEPMKARQIEQTNVTVKSTVIENVTLPEEYDTEALEDEIWKKQIASEYHQKRINFITQQGGLSSDESQLPQSSERPKK
ncbi:6464_t:CDS:2, partial [Racocetra persica]